MNQRMLCHFDLMVNEKYFQFSFVPGACNYDELDAALSQFKVELNALKETALELERKKKEEESAAQQDEAPVMEPELVDQPN